MDLHRKFKEIRKENIILTYSGLLNMEVINQLTRLAENALKCNHVHITQQRNVINIFIESLQNIHYHGNPFQDDKTSECMLLLARSGAHYLIGTGNFIKRDELVDLKSRLEKIFCLSLEELNQLYRETLNKGELSEKGGAGLGLIKILIDSKKQTSFHFEHIDETYSFFTLKTIISKSNGNNEAN